MTPIHKEFLGHGDLRIAADCFGDPADPPVILAHGGGQTRHAWRKTGSTLASAGFYVVTFDARGHGDSEWAKEGGYSLDAGAGDIIAIAKTLGPQKPVLVGASMGGMASLIAEGEHGNICRALILVDVATHMESKGIERILGFLGAHTEGFPSLEAAADAIAAYLPHRPRPKSLAGLEKNLRKGSDGRWHWHWDPSMMRVRGYVTPERLANAARTLRVPVLLVRGGSSDVVSLESIRVFKEQVPQAQVVDVSGAEHMVAGDENDAFTQAILDFLLSL